VGNSKEAATPPATPAFDFAPHLARMNVIEANVEHCKRQIAELSERLITNMLDTAVANARILPLHGRIEANNLSTPGTPEWRVNASAQYNNIWQLEHQIGVSYGFSPEKFKTEGLFDDYIFNRPQVAYYGAYYRVPLGSAPSVAEEISGSSQFGYNEATHEFRLPPVGGRPDLSFFASASSSDTGVKFGSETVVSRTPLLTIVSRDAGQNLSVNESAGARFNYPLALNDNHRLNLSAGPDLKRYELKSFNTNNFIVTTVVTNLQGSQTIQSIVASPQPVRENATTYLPISLGADYSGADKHGSSSAGIALIGNVVGNSDDFSALAYSREAKPTYLRGTVSISRDQKLPADWSLLLRANGQMASGPLLNTEQLALGGLGNVRGYFEGDEYGDAGWFGSAELRTPFLQSRVPTWNNFVPIWLRGSFFLDAGQRFLLDSANHSSRTLLGTGFGVSANINNALDMRISVGIPLIDSANTVAGDPHAYFSVGGQF
jgi:hemolysin activation/secretion protein